MHISPGPHLYKPPSSLEVPEKHKGRQGDEVVAWCLERASVKCPVTQAHYVSASSKEFCVQLLNLLSWH